MLNSTDTNHVRTSNTSIYGINNANTNTLNISILNISISNINISSTNISIIRTPDINTLIQALKQENIARLFKKCVFKFVTFKKFGSLNKTGILKKIPSSIQVFSSCFIHKIKNLDIYKAYKKCYLVLQAGNDKDKNFEMTNLLKIY